MKKSIGLVAHDNRKQDLMGWVSFNAKKLSTHYYNTKGDINVLTLKITTVYNDMIPPVEILRAMKIKNILE